MMTLNCTKKLAKELPFPLAESPQPSTNKLGPWCANVFNVGRTPMILLTNEKTLLSVVIPFKGIRSFQARFLESLEVLFHSIALSSNVIFAELEEMMLVQFTQDTNRRTLGSMNDFVGHIFASPYYDKNSTFEEISFRFSDIPCSPLRYKHPGEAALEILEVIDIPMHRDNINAP